jgi:hypothetical protein
VTPGDVVGDVLAHALLMADANDHARPILLRCLDGYRKLGRLADAARIEHLLRQIP